MHKRGQIAIFVIIAILIVGAISAFVLFSTGTIQAPVSAEDAQRIVASEVGPVKDLVTKCVKSAYDESALKIGLQGGYCSPVPVKNIKLGNYSLPYLVQKSGADYSNNILLLEGNGATITSEIDRCIDIEKITKCIDNFRSFKDVSVKPAGKLTWSVVITPPIAITLNIKYPLTISRGDASSSVNEMSTQTKTGLMSAYAVAVSVVNSEIKEHDFNMDEFARKNLDVRMDRQGTPEAIYYYLTTTPLEDEGEYNFNFAVDR